MLLSSRLYRKFGVLVVGALVISAMASSPALANGRMRALGTETCRVTPNPVSNEVSQQFYIQGRGFAPGTQFAILVNGGGWLGAVSDSYGNFVAADWTQRYADGTLSFTVYQAGDRHMTVLASCSLVVS